MQCRVGGCEGVELEARLGRGIKGKGFLES